MRLGGRPQHKMASFQMRVRDAEGAVGTQPFSKYWPQDRNELLLEDVGRHCNSRCVISRLCGKHLALLQPKSVFDNFEGRCNALDCKICGHFNNTKYQTHASTFELVAYRAVEDLPLDLGIGQQDWFIEASMLGGNFGAIDIYFPRFKLCIMIDGQLHFDRQRSNASAFTSAAVKQQARDARFNAEALSHGFSILRLHHADHGIFRQIIFKHILHFVKSTTQNRIAFSKSFPQEFRALYRDRLLDI